MGRFYQTSQGNYLDFIYQQPKNMLLQAVQVADSQIAEQEAKVADLYGRLKFNALTPDTQRRDEIIQGYKSEIDNLAEQIRANPLDFRRDTPIIRGLSDKIKDDIERGEISAIESNYATRKSYEEKLAEEVKAKLITADEKAQLLSGYDSKFKEIKGTQFKGTQNYNPYQTGYLAENVDMFKIVDDRLTGMKETFSEKFGWDIKQRGDGKYIVTSKRGNEEVSDERVRAAVTDLLKNDTQISEALGTRFREGIKGYDAQSISDMYNAGVNYAINKFVYDKKFHSGTVSEDAFAKAGYDDNLKNKYIPTSRNQDAHAYSSLYGGALTYGDAQQNANQQNQMFTNTANALIGDAQTQLLKNNGLIMQLGPNGVPQIVADPNASPLKGSEQDRINNYKNSMNAIQQQFDVAKTTGNFGGFESLSKQHGFKLDKDTYDNFSKNWTPTVAADLQNWETKKSVLSKNIAKQYGLTDPVSIEKKLAEVLSDPKYNIKNNTIFETQSVTHYDNEKQGRYVKRMELIGQNPVDFMTGKGGVFLLQGSQGQGGTPVSSDFNNLVQNNYINFVQNAKKDFVRDENGNIKTDDEGRNLVTYVGHIGGKEIRMTPGKVFHTYEDVIGLKDGYKYKQRFTFSNPQTGEVLEASMIQDEEHLPLAGTEFEDLKYQPQEVIASKAGKILTLATQENQNLVTDGLLSPEDAVSNVAEIPGLKVQALGNGKANFYYRGTQATEEEVLKMLKIKLNYNQKNQ